MKIKINNARFLKNEIIEDQEDTTYKKLSTNLYTLNLNEQIESTILADKDGVLIEMIKIKLEKPNEFKSLCEKVKAKILSLEPRLYEIWHKDHNVNDIEKGGIHLPDFFGEPSLLIDKVKEGLILNGNKVVDPPVNHNKVSSRKWDKFALNETHIDSFEGFRLNEDGDRASVYRYLMNFGDKQRTTAFCPYDRAVLSLVPLNYSTNLFDKLFEFLHKELEHVIITIPPADFENGIIYGIKILVTHVLHAEYGGSDDFLVTINSLE